MKTILRDYVSFLDKVFSGLKNSGFDEDEFKELDHLAYRTENFEQYEKIKSEFENFASDFSEVMISGRPIAFYTLKKPLIYGSWKIDGIELCAPKENNKYKEGLEHAEFVTKVSLEEFLQSHANTKFKMDAYEKETNRELVLKFGEFAIKFHEQSLLEIRGM